MMSLALEVCEKHSEGFTRLRRVCYPIKNYIVYYIHIYWYRSIVGCEYASSLSTDIFINIITLLESRGNTVT